LGHGLLGASAIWRRPVLRRCLREDTVSHRLGPTEAWETFLNAEARQKALNSPIGKLAQALMKDERLGSSAGGFPPPWLCKVDDLLGMAGAARRDALVIFSHQLLWIYGHAPGWAEAHLLSVLGQDREDERAFWSGFFWAAQLPGFELYARLKPLLLAMVATERDRSDHIDKIAGMLLAGWGTTQGSERCVSNDEMRQALRMGGDAFRRRMLWHLKTWSKQDGQGWGAQALVLLCDVWPRERAVRSKKLRDLGREPRAVPGRSPTGSS
jgi:hypothetical protein